MVADFKRFRSPLLAAGAIGAFVVAIDVALRVALGTDPAWMPPRLYNYVPYFGSRIARIEQLKQARQIDDAQLAVVLGLSSVQHGLDPLALEEDDPLARRWLVMGAAGGTIVDLEIACQPFLGSSLHPSLIVIGVHPWMLHRNDRMEHDTSLSWANHYSWLTKHHSALNSLAIIERDRSTAGLGRFFKLPAWEIYEPAADPWVNDTAFPSDYAPPDEMKSQWAGLQFELAPDQYHDNDVELKSFARLIFNLRNHGDRLVCVLMPESSAMRPSPPVVEAAFSAAVASLERRLDVIDLRNLIPDPLMHDFTHMNNAGRAKLSAMFPVIVQ